MNVKESVVYKRKEEKVIRNLDTTHYGSKRCIPVSDYPYSPVALSGSRGPCISNTLATTTETS